MANLAHTQTRAATRPAALKTLRGFLRKLLPFRKTREKFGLRPPEWYNSAYRQESSYNSHYTRSPYYFLWSVIADRMQRCGIRNVLDLGCGPGQFAAVLRDKGFTRYVGLDFSAAGLELAKKACPEFEFRQTDIVASGIPAELEYDCVVTLEFMEHILEDEQVMNSIRPGTHVFASVPNFPYESHVRHFSSTEEVHQRYDRFFSNLQVDAFFENNRGKTYFLLDGIRG